MRPTATAPLRALRLPRAKFLGRTAFLAVLLVIEMAIIMWNLTTMFAGVLIGPACIIFTISGFANTFFEVIERENLMAEVDEKTAEASDDEEDFESEEEEEDTDEE